MRDKNVLGVMAASFVATKTASKDSLPWARYTYDVIGGTVDGGKVASAGDVSGTFTCIPPNSLTTSHLEMKNLTGRNLTRFLSLICLATLPVGSVLASKLYFENGAATDLNSRIVI